MKQYGHSKNFSFASRFGAGGKSTWSMLTCVEGAYSEIEAVDLSSLAVSCARFRRVAVVIDCSGVSLGIAA